ncbi:Demethylmenaquinone methyltransferase [bioreactor metagenome]|uniref:Demethylmenaquinone methyltransferase n=1 Tax=bioreactor metagenome TaxID=1076179 RepID=A0A644TSL0_9ZZZZ|nr:demethylmenaquinone methyltransferase [Negativicutes bacterium]
MKNHTTDKAQFVYKLFSTIADHYDFMNSLLTLNQDHYWRKFAINKADLVSENKVLDVCCGTGKLTIGLAEKVGSNGTVIGLDFCEPMLAKAAVRISRSPVKERITLVQGNALELPYPDNEFDCVITGFGLRNLPEIEQPISEMRRVVRPGGKIISLELGKPTIPVLKQLYNFYFEQIPPLLGKFKVGKGGLYSWLPQSLKDYPNQAKVAQIFKNEGLRDVHYYNLTGGIAVVHVGVK